MWIGVCVSYEYEYIYIYIYIYVYVYVDLCGCVDLCMCVRVCVGGGLCDWRLGMVWHGCTRTGTPVPPPKHTDGYI